MIKVCEVCKKEYETKEGKQKTCGDKACSNASRSLWQKKKILAGIDIPKATFVSPADLPPIENLPAVFLKQCHDYWVGLVGDEEKGTRIA